VIHSNHEDLQNKLGKIKQMCETTKQTCTNETTKDTQLQFYINGCWYTMMMIKMKVVHFFQTSVNNNLATHHNNLRPESSIAGLYDANGKVTLLC
jgi:hypothetical protein